jgi:transcriptional regulator with XRE-family HTH domain
MSKEKLPSVAEFLRKAIELSGKTQKQIAREVGYDNPNIISLLKDGSTKLPIPKVAAFAKALNVDPRHFLVVVLTEYWPDTWKAVRDSLCTSPLTPGEFKFIQALRAQVGGIDLDPDHPDVRRALEEAFGKDSS